MNFRHRVLKRTDGLEYNGFVLWDVSLCNLLAWTVIFLVLTKGVQTLGKVCLIIQVDILIRLKYELNISQEVRMRFKFI